MAIAAWQVVRELPTGADAVAVGVFEGGGKPSEWIMRVCKAVGGAVGRIMMQGDFKGKAGSVMTVPVDGGLKRLMLVGLGKREGFDMDRLRWAAGSVAKVARGARIKKVVLCLHGDVAGSGEQIGQAIAEGAMLGGFAYREFRSEKERGQRSVGRGQRGKTERSFLIVEERAGMRAAVAEGARAGSVVGEATNYARDLACKPGNVMNPATLVAEARRLAGREKLKMMVIDAKRARAMGMGGLCAVGQGSLHPPAMIVLEYAGRGAAWKKPVVVIGKAITFDTGGYTLKSLANMEKMKYDKCGGMAVLGLLRAAARLRLPVRLVGVIPTAENSVSAEAYRPGDILRMYNGKTVEVTNTDAEGRLVLADALAYAAEKYKPAAMVDLATLTGGVVTALGEVYAGLFSNDEILARELEEAGRASGELLWRLPLHERYKGMLDGYHADLVNTGIREALPVQGAIFLQHFVPAGVTWAHVDIAGTANAKKEDRYLVKGATGFGVRVLLEWLRGKRP